MEEKAKHPWRIDTNSRYRDVVKMFINFSIATISIPILLFKNILNLDPNVALINLFDFRIFIAWGFLFLAICAGVIFYYTSAQWIRLAWELPSRFMFWKNMNDRQIENILDWTFWLSILFFFLGFVLIVWFIVTFV